MSQSTSAILFLSLCLLQLALSIYVWKFHPRPARPMPRLDFLRRYIVIAGFLPLGGLMLILQLPLFGLYHLLLAQGDANERGLTARLRAAGELDTPRQPQLKRPGGRDDNPFL